MNTFRQFEQRLETVPLMTSWYLAGLGEARGRQELFTRERWVHPLLALAAFNLDFLCIHPFRDGNGRASRLLMLAGRYQLGYEVGRYISLERLIEENKERYYETLEANSQQWHRARRRRWSKPASNL